MTKLLITGGVAFVLFIVFDFLWFSVAGNFFKSEIGSIARLSADGNWQLRIVPALLVYVLMAIALIVFVAPRVTTVPEAILFGGLFGLATYGVYDLTNFATLSAWTWRFAIVDMLWGTTLNAVVMTIILFLRRFIA